MAKTEYVLVKRVKHGDTLHIAKFVALKYPNEFTIIPDEKPKRAPQKKKVEVEPKEEN